MECEDEVLQKDIDGSKKFTVSPSNTCRFFCDDYLVAVVQCENGQFTGDVLTKGLYCYKEPSVQLSKATYP